MTGAKPNPLTRAGRIEQLLQDDLELKAQIATLDVEAKAQISTLDLKRAEIKAQLEALGEDAVDRWYFQEYRREFAVNDRREEKRRQRRATALERDEAVAAMKANPARRELLRNLISNANIEEKA
jgi:hypothetical protein